MPSDGLPSLPGATAHDLLVGEPELEKVKIYFGNASTFDFSQEKESPCIFPYCGFCAGVLTPPI